MNQINGIVTNNSVQATQNPNPSCQNELRLLKRSLMHILQMKEFAILKQSFKSANPMAMNTVGLVAIASKFDSYTDCSEFLADIKLLVQSYSMHFALEPGVRSVVDSLSELCDRNVNSIKTCAECFEHWLDDPVNYFVMVCSRPHLLVYAKVEGFPYWPSKVMSIKGNSANVAFFGDHTQADVPVNKCILYAKRNPLQNARPSEFNSALQEMNVHIRNIVKEFGSFCPTETKLLLDPQTMQRQLVAMIPGAFAKPSVSAMSAVHHKQRKVSMKIPEKAIKANEAARTVLEARNAGQLMTASNVNPIQSAPNAALNNGQPGQKRPAQATKSTEHSIPENKITRSVVGDDVQMHFAALSRRIIELEDENNRLHQEIKEQKLIHDASVAKYKQKIQNLQQQLQFAPVCTFCQKPAASPYFCNQRCQMNCSPAEDALHHKKGNDN